jgi:hypothetical protein
MSYSIVMMQPHHRPMVIALWQENLKGIGGSSELESRFSWLYDKNPDGGPVTALAIYKNEPVPVACASVLPRQMIVNGSPARAGMLIDFAVSPRHRFGAAALMLQRRLTALVEAGEFAFLLGYPNKSAQSVFPRIGYKAIGEATAWVKPLRVGYKLRPLIRNRLLVKALALPGDQLLATIDRFRPGSGAGARFESPEKADERFDALWQGARASFPITTARTSAYLNWRYTHFTTMSYNVFGVASPASGELIGYVIYALDAGNVYIADLFASSVKHPFTTVLHSFCDQMRRRGADTVFFRYLGGEGIAEHLRRLGFFVRPENTRNLVAYVGNSVDSDSVVRPANWYATDGEMDI